MMPLYTKQPQVQHLGEITAHMFPTIFKVKFFCLFLFLYCKKFLMNTGYNEGSWEGFLLVCGLSFPFNKNTFEPDGGGILL